MCSLFIIYYGATRAFQGFAVWFKKNYFEKISNHNAPRTYKKCVKWLNLCELNMKHAMFECDGIICLVRAQAECIECGVEKTRGIGLQYDLKISKNEITIVSPTSKAYTADECVRIIRSLCNILHYACRINRPQDDLLQIIKPLMYLIKTKITSVNNISTIIPQKYHRNNILKLQIKKIIKSVLDHQNIKFWD